MRADALAGRQRDAGLDQPARREDLPCLVRRRVGDEGAAIALAAHKAFEGQHLQRGAHDGAADVEQAADLAFRKLGAGRKPAVDDGVAQLIADRLRAILAGAVDGRKAVIFHVHDRCRPCFF